MMYGIIYNRGNGRHAFMMRQFVKFQNPQEEQSLAPHIVKIIEEPTGDGWLLAEKIASYAREHHLSLEFSIDLAGVNRSESLSDREKIEMLKSSVRVLALKLEEEQKKVWGLEYARWCESKLLESAEYVLDHNNSVLEVAIKEFGDENIVKAVRKATKKYERERIRRLN